MKNRQHKTLIGTKMWHKNPQKKSNFCSAEMVPQKVVQFLTLEVVQFLTLEVVQFLTLERPKGGTETNPPPRLGQ